MKASPKKRRRDQDREGSRYYTAIPSYRYTISLLRPTCTPQSYSWDRSDNVGSPLNNPQNFPVDCQLNHKIARSEIGSLRCGSWINANRQGYRTWLKVIRQHWRLEYRRTCTCSCRCNTSFFPTPNPFTSPRGLGCPVKPPQSSIASIGPGPEQ